MSVAGIAAAGAHTCPPLRGGGAQGLAAISTTSGPWMASGAPSATTVPPTSVPRLGTAPPVDGHGGSGGAGAREVSPRGLPSLHEGSGHGQPEQRRREGRPAPAAPMAVLFRRDGLQPVAGHLGPRATSYDGPRPRRARLRERPEQASAAACSCRFVRACSIKFHPSIRLAGGIPDRLGDIPGPSGDVRCPAHCDHCIRGCTTP